MARRALVIGLLFVTACNREGRARRELTGDGYTDIVLTKNATGFAFTAKNAGGQHCTGDVELHGGTEYVTSRCTDVCTKTESSACFTMGQRAEATDPNEAIRDYETGCDVGDMSSCVNLGMLYDKGKGGIPKDPIKSYIYDKKACDGKDAQGCLNVAIDYEDGLGTAKDPEAAYRAADFACTAKLMGGCRIVGTALLKGNGVPRDIVTGIDKLDRACSGQAWSACLLLGVSYVEGKYGVTRDVAHGQKLLENACSHDEVTSCFDLGHYIRLKTIQGSDATMVDYLKKACDGNEGGGCNELGLLMEQGKGGLEKDMTAAIAQYDKACSKDDATGCRNEGICYEMGRGVPKDLAKAKTLYAKGCANGNDECCKWQKELKP